ncbi:hypothetical protein BDL97_18G083600 [Sphagnum fallax]|nr:hypothetical protein BDL97_18G083600 [Sphagnum fallax]
MGDWNGESLLASLLEAEGQHVNSGGGGGGGGAAASNCIEYFSAFPSSIKYLVWNGFCERFSFFSVKSILALYFLEHLHLSENESTELVHLFIVACFATPLLEHSLGKYRTILYLSVVYCIGNWVLPLAATPKPGLSTKTTVFWYTAEGLALIALGTGGIKPCAVAFGGDQIQYTLPDGPTRHHLHHQFFSIYYFAMSAGALISTILTPILRTCHCYIDRLPEGNVFGEVGAVVIDAVKLRGRAGQGSHWLNSSKLKHNPTVVEDVKALFGVLILLLPMPLFACLFDQQSSKWVFQVCNLDGHVPWLFNVVIQPDQMQALHPVLILAMIPLFDQVICPFLEKQQVLIQPVLRILFSMMLGSLAFLLSGLLQNAMDHVASTEAPPLSILWQTPQFVAISTADIMVSITFLEFAYSQAPDSMKSVIQAAWLFAIAAGNLVMELLVAIIGDRLSRANEFFFFALVCGVGTLLLLWGGSQFVYKQDVLVLRTKLLSNSLQSNLITEAQNTKTHGDSFAQQLQIKMTC